MQTEYLQFGFKLCWLLSPFCTYLQGGEWLKIKLGKVQILFNIKEKAPSLVQKKKLKELSLLTYIILYY